MGHGVKTRRMATHTTCGHAFVEHALRAWVSQRGTCPVCGKEVSNDQIKIDPLNQEAVGRFFQHRSTPGTSTLVPWHSGDRPVDGSKLLRSSSMHILSPLIPKGEENNIFADPTKSPKPQMLSPKSSKRPRLETSFEVASEVDATKKPTEQSLVSDSDCCAICTQGDSDATNTLLQCARCKCSIHQGCYGVTGTVGSDWTCSKCTGRSTDEADSLRCAICQHAGGAIQRTNCGKWVHVVCALWTPEVNIVDITTMRPVDISTLDEDRFKLTCAICNLKQGACIQCSHRACTTAFHASCARSLKWTVENPGEDLPFTAYCGAHILEYQAAFCKPA